MSLDDAAKRSVLGKVPLPFEVRRSRFLHGLGIDGDGLYTTMPLHNKDWIGEYRGVQLSLKEALAKKRALSYMFDVEDKNGKVLHVLDAANKAKSSFVRYVNAANFDIEQNTKFVPVAGHRIFLRAIRDIPANTELLAWYGKRTKDVINQK